MKKISKKKTKEARKAISAWQEIALAKESLFPSITTTTTENYTKGGFPGKKKIPPKNLKVSPGIRRQGKMHGKHETIPGNQEMYCEIQIHTGLSPKRTRKKKPIILYDI